MSVASNICFALAVIALLLLMIELFLILSGSGIMSLFGLSKEYDHGSAIFGTYNINPYIPDVGNPVYYSNGTNLTTILVVLVPVFFFSGIAAK